MSSIQVAGWLLLGVFRFIKDKYGQDILKDLIASTSKSTQSICSEKIRVLNWYPYSCYVELLSAIDQQLGGGSGLLCQKLGESGGSLALDNMFKVYRKFGDPERMIRAAPKIWNRYFLNAGCMEAISWLPDNTVWRVNDFPQMHPLQCRALVGWLMGAFANLAAANSEIRVEIAPNETKCTSKGDPYHEIMCRWRRLAK